MKSMAKWTATVLFAVPLFCSTALADTSATSTDTASATAQVSAQTTLQQRFEAAYAKNQATESTLLQQATQVQSPTAAQYQSFVNALSTQVSTLYASETSLAALPLLPKAGSTKQEGLLKEEQNLKVRLQNDITAGKKMGNKSTKEKRALQRLGEEMKQLNRTILHLDATMRVILKGHVASGQANYRKHLQSLKESILGLQADEIRATNAWVISGQTDVTGSVYGSTNTTGSTGNA